MTTSVSAGVPARATRVVVVGAEDEARLGPVLRGVPPGSGLAVVAVCRVAPPAGDPSAGDKVPVVSALPLVRERGRVRLEPDRVLLVPPDSEAAFERDELIVTRVSARRAPLDKLLRSLADEHGSHGICVLLDCRDSDGMLGIKRLKEAGGLTIAAEPDGSTAGIWRSLLAGGIADLVLPLPAIAERLVGLGRPRAEPAERSTAAEDAERRGPDTSADTLQDILVLLRIRTGHDFSSYKRATLYRRVSRRMQVCQCDSVAAYHLYLREHADEISHLLRDLLISVTSFFRDRDAFEALAANVIPRVFEGHGSDQPVRVWVAGCATGEEAYSIGMLLCEHAAAMRTPPQPQIFATDIDEEALIEARIGRYPGTIAVDVSPERLDRFFTPDGEYFRISKELREVVLFSPHNVLRDPPFSRLDLIACRNLLIYLNRDAQDRVLGVFHFGLRFDGFLFLGSSESAENTALFTAVDAKRRLFMRRPSSLRPGGDPTAASTRREPPVRPQASALVLERATAGQLHHQLVERYAPPSVMVNAELDILHASERAGLLMQLAGGEPSRQLLRLIHPGLRLDLRTAIHAARQDDLGSDTRVVRFRDGDHQRAVEIRVRKVEQAELAPGALLVMFDELDPARSVEVPAPSAGTELEPLVRELEDELRRTREQLRVTIEQYETTVEELKASNEELQAINEELRSATEELETSKEELQSVNEELITLNHELKHKIDEVSHANSDLQNLMTSTDIGVVFLDREFNIKRFTPRAQDLFNVIPSDIGRPLAHLTHKLEADDLPELAQSVLQTLRTVEREVQGRDGRRYLARLLPYRSLEDRIGGVVLTFVDVSDLRDAIDARQRTEAALEATERRLRFALRSAPMVVVNLDDQLAATWGYVLGEELESREARGDGFLALFAPGHAERFTEAARAVLRDGNPRRVELDVLQQGEPRTYDVRIERNELGVSMVGFDIAAGKRAQAMLLDADRRKDEFLATLSHELRNPLTPLKVALDVLKLASDDPVQLERTRAIMERQVTQLTQLVDDLLDLSRIAQGKLQLERAPVEIGQVIEAAIETMRPVFQQRRHQLSVEVPRQPLRISGDRARLVQVFTNLLGNAAKYTPPGGHVALAVAIDRPRNRLLVRIRDDGDGIAPELLPRIFDIFVQSRDPNRHGSGGLGIGLNLVQRLVKLHGGSVTAASEGSGRGSEFVVELPLGESGNAA